MSLGLQQRLARVSGLPAHPFRRLFPASRVFIDGTRAVS